MIDFELTDEQQLIRETAREFADKEIAPRARENDRNEHFDTELVKQIADMGFLGAIVPEEYGGRGVDYRTYALIVEEIGRGCSAMRTVVSVVTSLVCSSIVRWGSEEQKQEWLPQLCSGEALGCFGLTEPDTGSDAANLKTRAEKIDGGWRISGGKKWISLGNYAKLALVFAQTDPSLKHRGIACFLVPTDSDGLLHPGDPRQARPARAPTRPSSRSTAWRCRTTALLGEVGDGFKVAMSALDSGRYSVAAGCVGICQGCVDASVAYSKERTQFGRPIASFQLVQEMIADMVVQTEAARGLVWRAGWLKDTGQPNTTETSVAKLFATEAAVELRQHRDPGARRLGLRGRLPGRALPARRARDHALRGHVADPEADHRPRRDTGVNAMVPMADASPSETRRRGRARAAQPARGAQRALARADGGARGALRALGRRPRGALHRDRGRRRVVRRGRGHQGDGRAHASRRRSPPRRRASGRGWRRCARRSSPRCPATRSAAAASSRWPAT